MKARQVIDQSPASRGSKPSQSSIKARYITDQSQVSHRRFHFILRKEAPA